MRLYPLFQAANPPETKFTNLSGTYFNTIHANTEKFYEAVNQIVQEEQSEAQDLELLGQMMTIGLAKGKPFAPDDAGSKLSRMRLPLAMPPQERQQGNNWVQTVPGEAWWVSLRIYGPRFDKSRQPGELEMMK